MDRAAFARQAQSSIAPVVVITPEAVHQVGTAFCVAPSGVWITARHVFEGREGAIEYRDGDPHAYIAILWAGSGGDSRIPIRVESFTLHPASGSDLALLWTGAIDIEFPALRLSALVPPVGTPLVALGYPRFETGTAENGRMQILPNLEINFGEVTEMFIDGRHKRRDLDGEFTADLPTVFFQTTARVDGAMSGGPVLLPSGSVCGVAAKGLNRSVPEEPDASSISGTPYIFMLKVAYGEDDVVSVYDLARQGVVLCDESFDRLRMTDIDGQLRVFYADE